MTAVLVGVLDSDTYSADDRAVLEARWERACRDLDEARRHVEIAAGLLYPLLAVDLIEAFAGRWVRDTHAELERLDLLNELPRDTR